MRLIEQLKIEKANKKSTRNKLKTEYVKYKSEIEEALEAGYTIKDIQSTLTKNKNINMSYAMLRYYISKSKKKHIKEIDDPKEKQKNEALIKEKPKKIYGRKDVLKPPVEKKLIWATIPDPKKLF